MLTAAKMGFKSSTTTHGQTFCIANYPFLKEATDHNMPKKEKANRKPVPHMFQYVHDHSLKVQT